MPRITAKPLLDSEGNITGLDVTKDGRSINVTYNPERELIIEGQSGLLPDLKHIIELFYPNQNKIQRIESIGTLENDITPAKIKQVREGFHQIERWHSGFLKEKWSGRTISYFKSEAHLAIQDLTTPPILKGLDPLESAPFNNVVDMRNSIDGTTVDELYFGLPLAFKRACMRVNAKLPAPAAGYYLGFGFEVIGAGGHAISYLTVGAANTDLVVAHAKLDGTIEAQTTTLGAHPSTDMRPYMLTWDGHTLHLSNYTGGAWAALDSVSLGAEIAGQMYVLPFFMNESSVVTAAGAYYLGFIQIWRFDKQKPNTPVIYNKTMTNANTEYSQALPAGTKKFRIHTRDGTPFRLAFETGKVATPTAPYWTTYRPNDDGSGSGDNWAINDMTFDNIECSALTVYFACTVGGKVIEIIAWS